MLPFIPAAITAGSNIIGNLLGAGAQNKANRDQRNFTLQMYNQQRQDSLADWNRQNEYNSPTSQMARLRTAGLNENLVYGNGQAVQAAGPVRSSDSGSYRPEAFRPDFSSIGPGFSSVYDLQLKEAQTDNLKAQNTVLLNDAILKAAQIAETNARTAKTTVDTQTGSFSLGQSQRLADISADAAAANLRKLQVDTGIALDTNERQKALTSSTLAQAAESILKSRSDRATSIHQRNLIDAQIQSVLRDPNLKDLDIDLKKLGISPNDPVVLRVLGRVLSNPNVQKTAKSLYENLRVYLEKVKLRQN